MNQAHGVHVYSAQSDILGEAPLWSIAKQTLYWLDIGRKTLQSKASAVEPARVWPLPDYPGCLAELGVGEIAIAVSDGIQRLNLSTGRSEPLSILSHLDAALRFNDGKVDPQGRFWAGTMRNNFTETSQRADDVATGCLYRFDRDGRVHTMEEGVGIGNTLAWSPDHKHFYFADSEKGQMYVYDFDADSGAISNKRVFLEKTDFGVPDGSAMDCDGCLWNARWDGSALLRITPAGELDRVVPLPIPRPTSCCFGGNNLATLFVTSARSGLTSSQCTNAPLSGSVFAIHGLAQGMPVPPYAFKSAF
jgi:sugar lactone lactonase YvrE